MSWLRSCPNDTYSLRGTDNSYPSGDECDKGKTEGCLGRRHGPSQAEAEGLVGEGGTSSRWERPVKSWQTEETHCVTGAARRRGSSLRLGNGFRSAMLRGTLLCRRLRIWAVDEPWVPVSNKKHDLALYHLLTLLCSLYWSTLAFLVFLPSPGSAPLWVCLSPFTVTCVNPSLCPVFHLGIQLNVDHLQATSSRHHGFIRRRERQSPFFHGQF